MATSAGRRKSNGVPMSNSLRRCGVRASVGGEAARVAGPRRDIAVPETACSYRRAGRTRFSSSRRRGCGPRREMGNRPLRPITVETLDGQPARLEIGQPPAPGPRPRASSDNRSACRSFDRRPTKYARRISAPRRGGPGETLAASTKLSGRRSEFDCANASGARERMRAATIRSRIMILCSIHHRATPPPRIGRRCRL